MNELVRYIESKAQEPHTSLRLRFVDGKILLEHIEVSIEARGRSLGTFTMMNLCELADEYNLDIFLHVSGFFGTNVEVLRSWYARFGFVHIDEVIMLRTCSSAL